MGKETTILVLAGVFIFGLAYFNKMGCKGDGTISGPDTALCWNGPSIEEMFGGGGSTTEAIEEMEPPEDDEIADARERTATRQITPVNKRGIISKKVTSDPRGSGGGVGGPGYEAALAHAYFVNNRITLA